MGEKNSLEARIENKLIQMMENFIQTSSTILLKQLQRLELLETEIRKTNRNEKEQQTDKIR